MSLFSYLLRIIIRGLSICEIEIRYPPNRVNERNSSSDFHYEKKGYHKL